MRFESLEPRQLLATIVAADTGGNWLSSSTWVGGNVPGAGDRVLIGKHTTTQAPILVTLNSAAPHVAKEIVINGGTLRVLESGTAERTLTTEWMHVNSGGTFRVGLANDRYDNNSFRLTLTGSDPTADWTVETATGTMAINDNNGFLMTASGGQLQFYGDEKLSFTKLAATVNAGSNTITVENVIERNFDGTTSTASDGSLDWQVGDEIVIASSSYDYTHEEVRTITAINTVPGDPTKTQLTLNAVLAHRHYGEVESYSNPDRTFDIDLRAEVALLNRTINIEGTQDTDNNFGDRANYGNGGGQNVGIGAHAMIMPGSGQITIDGVRFDQMGQTGRLGRYPVHWHVAGNRGPGGTNTIGDVMRNSSVTNSNNRGVTIHGTQNVLIEDNVLHDIHGHGFFMEDAAETGNQFISNIVLGIHKVGGDDGGPDANDPFIVPGITRGNDGRVNGEAPRNGNGESSHDTGENNARRFLHSAAYWITNPDNTWVGNVSAGSEGTGFWFALPDAVLGLSKDTGLYNNLDPNNTNLGQFDYNTSHSSPIGLTFDRGADLLPGSSNNYHPPQIMQVNHFTGYKHDGTAVYHRAQRGIFNESRFADNAHSSFNTFNQEEHNVLFVGHSQGNSDPNAQVAGYKLYDGPGRIKNSHFAGFAAANAHTFMVEPGSRKHSHHAAEGITYENDGTANHLSIEFITRANATTDNVPEYIFGRPHTYSGILLDVDGSLTGHAGGGQNHVLVPKIDFNRDSDDIAPAGWNAYISNDRYAELRLNVHPNERIPDFRITNGAGHFMDVDRLNTVAEQWLYAKVNAGDYTVDFFEPLPASGLEAFLEVRTFGHSGDATVLRFVGVGEDFKPSSGVSVSSLSELRQASQTSYLRDYAGDLWINIFESNTKIQIAPTNDPLPPNPQSAFVSTTIENGTRIEAEEFDLGGPGIAYTDTTAGNSGSVFRTNQDVDIQATTDAGGGFNVGWTDYGEVLEYTTNIVGDVYDIGFRVASDNNDAKSIRLLVGDGNVAETFTELGVINVPDTGGDQTWQTLVLEDIDLTAWQGTDRVLRVEIIGGSFNLNWLEFNDQQAPFVAQTITDGTRVLVEEFDVGGEGVAYHDTTPENTGGTARQNEGVDIGGQFLVLTNIADGEWLEFTRDIDPGIYDVTFRVFTNRSNPNRSIRLLVADNDSTENYTLLGSVDPTGTLNAYENFVIPNVDLTSFGGTNKVLRLEFVGGQHNFDWFEFQAVAQPSSVVTRGVAYGGASAGYGEDAIDTTKSAYLHLPGTSSTVANYTNYTNYTQGLNRVVVELANSQQATLTNADFEFRVGNTNDPSSWQLLDGSSAIPLPTIINGTRDGGSGKQRFTIAWENENLPTIKNSWLQVTVKANANTGLTADDVFYFGNQVGDVNGSTLGGRVTVNVGDTNGVRQNQAPVPNLVSMASPNYVYDLDRSGEVTVGDTNAARLNQAPAGGLLMISAPATTKAATSDPPEPAIVVETATVAEPAIASIAEVLQSPIETEASPARVNVSPPRKLPKPVLNSMTHQRLRQIELPSMGTGTPIGESKELAPATERNQKALNHQSDHDLRRMRRKGPSPLKFAANKLAETTTGEPLVTRTRDTVVDAIFAKSSDPFGDLFSTFS